MIKRQSNRSTRTIPFSKEPHITVLHAFFAASVVNKGRGWKSIPRHVVLNSIANALDANKQELLAITSRETALTEAELAPEFARMVGTLRMFANLVREGSWVRASIDPAAAKSIGPGHDVRSMLRPLGPVAIFGASNFPLAYGVCGGDTASALAAGCPVVVKEHPAHPRTGRKLAQIARDAIDRAGANPLLLGYVPHEDPKDLSVPRACVENRVACAIGFTGSRAGGLALDQLARSRPNPIPVFAEMGSVNFVRVTDAALKTRGKEIGDMLADSILQRFGQQCTKPGLIIVQNASTRGKALVRAMVERFRAAPARDMLAPWIRDAYKSRLARLKRTKGFRTLAEGDAARGPRSTSAALLLANWKHLKSNLLLHEEIFGPATIIVNVSPRDILSLPRPDSLVGSIFCETDELRDDCDPACLRDMLADHVGRLAFNTVTTGVRVAHGMVHGGPFPATNRPDTTAVGPYAIERWCRPVCYQNCPDALLPPELQNANPHGILRLVNGVPTRDAIKP